MDEKLTHKSREALSNAIQRAAADGSPTKQSVLPDGSTVPLAFTPKRHAAPRRWIPVPESSHRLEGGAPHEQVRSLVKAAV